MPTQLEQELLVMLDQHRRATVTEVSTLPDLIPEALLSPSAQADMRAMASIQTQRAGEASRFTARPYEATVSAEALAPAPTMALDEILASLFMEQAQREIEATGLQTPAEGVFDIEFENGDSVWASVQIESPRVARGFEYSSAGEDTRVVARRYGGRFVQAPPPIVSVSERREQRVQQAATAAPQSSKAQDTLVRKSSYERLLGPSVLDE